MKTTKIPGRPIGPLEQTMFVHVTDAKYTRDYKVWLAFNDGAQGEIDLSAELHGEVFEPLRYRSFFPVVRLGGTHPLVA